MKVSFSKNRYWNNYEICARHYLPTDCLLFLSIWVMCKLKRNFLSYELWRTYILAEDHALYHCNTHLNSEFHFTMTTRVKFFSVASRRWVEGTHLGGKYFTVGDKSIRYVSRRCGHLWRNLRCHDQAQQGGCCFVICFTVDENAKKQKVIKAAADQQTDGASHEAKLHVVRFAQLHAKDAPQTRKN